MYEQQNINDFFKWEKCNKEKKKSLKDIRREYCERQNERDRQDIYNWGIINIQLYFHKILQQL